MLNRSRNRHAIPKFGKFKLHHYRKPRELVPWVRFPFFIFHCMFYILHFGNSSDSGVPSAETPSQVYYIPFAFSLTSSIDPTYKNACSGSESAPPLMISSKLRSVSASFT